MSLHDEANSILQNLRALRALQDGRSRVVNDTMRRRILELQERYSNALQDPILEEVIDEIEYLATTIRRKSPAKYNPSKGRV